MNARTRWTLSVAVAFSLTGCLQVDHFTQPPQQYDNLFFGPSKGAKTDVVIDDYKWRNYAIFGLVPWREAQLQWAGTTLGETGATRRPLHFYIETERSVTNWLASFGLSLVGGILAPLLFEPRTTELKAWSMK